MNTKALLALTSDFLSLTPTPAQVFNTLKFAYCFFLDKFDEKPNYHPISIGLYITYHCNITCEYCWNHTINDKQYFEETLSVEDLTRLMSHPDLKYAFRVSFVGGEPLAHPDIFKFFDICRKAKKLVMFPSNGLLISKRIKEFENNGPHSLQVSLYDDYIEEQLGNIRLLKKVNSKINLSIGRYITSEKSSYASMERFIGIADELGIKNICFQNFQPQEGKDGHLSIYDDDTEIIAHFDQVRNRYGKKLNIMFPAPLTRNPNKRFCYDLYTVVFVGKNGKISPCSNIVPPNDKFGNIWQDDFWNNKYLVAHRKNYNKNFPFHPACEFCYEGAKHARYFI